MKHLGRLFGLVAYMAMVSTVSLAQQLQSDDIIFSGVRIVNTNNNWYSLEVQVTNRGNAQGEINMDYSFSCGLSGAGGQLASGEIVPPNFTKSISSIFIGCGPHGTVNISFGWTYWTALTEDRKYKKSASYVVPMPGSASGMAMMPLEVGFNRQGSDLFPRGIPGDNPSECASACMQNAVCMAMTFVAGQDGGVCWLKGIVPSKTRLSGAVSSYKALKKQ